MHSLPKLRTALLASLALVAGAFADDVADLLAEAQRAYFRGDIPAAKEKFDLVRKFEPNNRVAVGFLKRIAADDAAKKASLPPGTATEAALKKVILEKVDFQEATLVELLEFLRQKGNQITGDKIAINFVCQLDDQAKNTKITLSMRKVPFTEVLRYIGELANVQFAFEPYAIVVKPKAAAAAAGTPQPEGGIKIQGL